MKRWTTFLLLAIFLFCISLGAVPAHSEEDAEAEWTILFYFCGSDLESKYSFATSNLEEIYECDAPENTLLNFEGFYEEGAPVPLPGKVNVLLETGGCKEWHAQNLGMDIDVNSLQRWKYECYTEMQAAEKGITKEFILEDTLPSASMADPATLTDFIRWGAENYPAKKYGLILWDHGGGSKTGLFIDELYNGDILYLNELGLALSDAGVVFETVLFDACMMGSFETAYAIRNNAKWMVASEEVVPGKGTAVNKWLQELYYNPSCSGLRLGRCICDMTLMKYANDNDEQAMSLLTWAVIDLSHIDRVAELFDLCYKKIGEIYSDYPPLMAEYAKVFRNAEEYGSGEENMFDLADNLYDATMRTIIEPDLRGEMQDALEEAVIYIVRGPGRSAARGLSYCYASDFSEEELNHYYWNCPSPHYLALMDAINPWKAPEELYNQVPRLPSIDDLDAYKIIVNKCICEDGTPGLSVEEGMLNVQQIYYRLYQKNESTGQVIRLGLAPAYEGWSIDGQYMMRAYEPWTWPAVEGVHCNMEIKHFSDGDCLCDIPIQLGQDMWNLRCGYIDSLDEYVIYGLWEGFDADSEMFNRNVRSLSQVAGQEYRLLYPTDEGEGAGMSQYAASELMPMYRSLEVTEKELPVGTYYIQYEVEDIFMRHIPLARIEMHWDGETLSFPADTEWEGREELVWKGWKE